jgi:superfamily I DNA and/or RNA helicase
MEKYEDKISQLLNIQYRMHDDIMRFSNEHGGQAQAHASGRG